MEWEKKVVMITGASSGIGEALAYAAASSGSRLILVARREDRLLSVKKGILSKYPGTWVQTIAADIKSEADCRKLVKTCTNYQEGLHILIHNAGITAHGRFEVTQDSVLRDTMEINFFAPARLTRLLLPIMKESPGPKKIVYVSTPSGFHGIPERAAYSASKAAGNMLMETLRFELEPWNIGTMIFAPGYTKTELRTSGLGPDGKVISEDQEKNAKTPEEVASLLMEGVRKDKTNVFTDLNGRAVYWLRVLAPRFLFNKIKEKTGRSH